MVLACILMKAHRMQPRAPLEQTHQLHHIIPHIQCLRKALPILPFVVRFIIPPPRILLQPTQIHHQRRQLLLPSNPLDLPNKAPSLIQNTLLIPPNRRATRNIRIKHARTREERMQGKQPSK